MHYEIMTLCIMSFNCSMLIPMALLCNTYHGKDHDFLQP